MARKTIRSAFHPSDGLGTDYTLVATAVLLALLYLILI